MTLVACNNVGCDTVSGYNYVCDYGIEEAINLADFNIYPNPTSGNFVISSDKFIMKGNVEILNILGETVFKENISNESKIEISLKNVSSGIYFVKVFDGEVSFCKKLIVE